MVNVLAVFVCGLVLVSAAQLKDGDVLQDYQRLTGLRSLGVEFAEHFRNASLTDLDLFQSRIPSQDDLLCIADMTEFMLALTSGKLWALRMIDAWGSIPSGLLYGNIVHLGNFDECIKISNEITSSHSINGKYCFLKLSIGSLPQNVALLTNSLKIASCFPASCSAAIMDLFLEQLVQKLFNSGSLSMNINEASCQTSESKPLDGMTIFTVVLLGLMGTIVALCTLYDYFLCHDQSSVPAIVKIFSARSSSRAIFRIVDSKSNPNVISCLDGIRCMSLFWVVFGHEYIFSLLSPNINTLNMLSWVEQPFSSLIMHGVFSVDSFFFVGGLLVAVIALRSMEKSNGSLNAPLMYLHRLIRIVPVLAVAILVYMKFMPVVSGGPLFAGGYTGSAACESGWFWTLLFVQNYATSNICLAHSWYLAVDMQLYLISPLLLIALYKWGKKAAAGIVVLVLLVSSCLFATMMIKKYSLVLTCYKNINCTSLDKEFCNFEYCYLKSVNRTYKYMSLKVNLYKIPIRQVNFSLLKRFNGYKPFLYNITVDACKILKYPKSNPVFGWFHSLFSAHSNMNHTCPFDHDLVVDKLSADYINKQFTEVLPYPHGQYLFHSNWFANNVKRASVNVYGTLS
ncbi:GL13843 [Drosophila persimilis]|uniref:GL13843 n=1 Tax=Drosophila persimilis TaxID=7234 RepID=B4GPA3_DROPE|nr:GL13843 [Drosophila persimilis]